RDLPPERRRAHAEAAEGSAVPFVDETDVALVDTEPAGQILARGIDVLAMPPKRELFAVPLGDAAERLHAPDRAAAEVVGELPHDVGLGESLLDIAAPPHPTCARVMVGMARRELEEIAFALPDVDRALGLRGRERRDGRQIEVVDDDRFDR